MIPQRNEQKNLLGERFGKLVVLKAAEKVDTDRDDGGNTAWLCLCDCGKETVVRTFMLTKEVSGDSRHSGVRSCGCARAKIKLLGDEASFRNLFYEYKYAAKQRGLLFELAAMEFRELTSSDCKYCGAKPNKLARATKGTRVHYVYNGIDRFDNQYGYTKENCVPCCSTCNHMKCQMVVSDFLAHAKRIADFTAVYNSARLTPEFN